jgi:hypothetical protein
MISIRKETTNTRPKYYTIGKKNATIGIAALFGNNKAIKVGDFLNDEK